MPQPMLSVSYLFDPIFEFHAVPVKFKKEKSAYQYQDPS